MVSYWWLQDDITVEQGTSHSFEIQSYECEARKEEHDARDLVQLQEPEVLRSCSPEKEKVAEGIQLPFFIIRLMDLCMADFSL